MSVAMLRADLVKVISSVEDEELLQEISLLLAHYSDASGNQNEIGTILGAVDYDELAKQLNEPEEEYSWEDVKMRLKSFS